MNDTSSTPAPSAVTFHLPTKPVTLIDAINRAALAIGSMRSAQLCETAEYNGHANRVDWNEFRGYYVAEYFWAGRVVISRGSCEQVLTRAIEEFARQGRGASLVARVKAEDADVARRLGMIEGEEPKGEPSDWRFSEVGHAASFEQRYGVPATAFLLQTTDQDEYRRLCAKGMMPRVKGGAA